MNKRKHIEEHLQDNGIIVSLKSKCLEVINVLSFFHCIIVSLNSMKQ